MATLVFVHAHPDDEASSTGGSMARAAVEGHRVVLVVCTDGRHGEAPEDLGEETVVERRRTETERSAEVLGVARVVWLGYADSGMTGWPQNEDSDAFLRADPDEAAERLAAVLREERADVVVVYDWHGVYGHPDHIQVHRVGHRAADLAGTPRRFEVTWNRDAMVALIAEQRADGEMSAEEAQEFDPSQPMDDGNPFGTPEGEINLAVDVSAFTDRKRAALAAHASQVTDIGAFLAMPEVVFAGFFGTEWYIEPGAAPGLRHGWLLEGV
jgi:LmbE family N-acetylglucosaminyl deacetylase